MIKALLLDVDGVLVVGGTFSESLARDHGITRETMAPFFRECLPACLLGRADLREELSKYVQGWGWQQSVDDFLRYWFTAEQTVDNQLVLAIQLMRQQGMQCYLATNQEKYRSVYLWNKMGFNKKFDGLFVSSQIGYMKPDTAFYQHILQTLNNILPHEILFWDDNEENVVAASKVGLRAELYTNFANFVQKTSRHIMPGVPERK